MATAEAKQQPWFTGLWGNDFKTGSDSNPGEDADVFGYLGLRGAEVFVRERGTADFETQKHLL